MDSYSLSYTLDPEQGWILSGLVRRCRDINGWGSQELLQYAATANSLAEVDLKLDFLQDAVTHLEIVNSTQAEKTPCASRRRNGSSAAGLPMPLRKCTALTSWCWMPGSTAL